MSLRLYQHRINTVEALLAVPPGLGIEFDLRSDGDRVIVTHDPFTTGPRIEDFFPHVKAKGPRPCIFNVKCEGIEPAVQSLARAHGIEDYFFLDLSVPAAVKLAREGERRLAVRYSEYEPAAAVLAWAGRAEWVWVDCFTRFPADPEPWAEIARHFKICLVSPELQGHGVEAIEPDSPLRRPLRGLHFDAACTKRPDLWAERVLAQQRTL